MRRSHWILLLILAAALALSGMAHAQSKTLYLERFDVDITVLPNGDFFVEEIQEIVFTGVEVWEGSRQYEQGYGGEYNFYTFVPFVHLAFESTSIAL